MRCLGVSSAWQGACGRWHGAVRRALLCTRTTAHYCPDVALPGVYPVAPCRANPSFGATLTICHSSVSSLYVAGDGPIVARVSLGSKGTFPCMRAPLLKYAPSRICVSLCVKAHLPAFVWLPLLKGAPALVCVSHCSKAHLSLYACPSAQRRTCPCMHVPLLKGAPARVRQATDAGPHRLRGHVVQGQITPREGAAGGD